MNRKPRLQPNGFVIRENPEKENKERAIYGQDKYAPRRVRVTTGQPVALVNIARTQSSSTNRARTQKRSTKRQTVQVASWVRRPIKAEIQRLAMQEKLSESKVVAALLEIALQQHVDMQYGALLRPVIEEAIDRRMRSRDARFVALLLRAAYDAGQTRFLVTNFLSRQPGVSQEILKKNLEMSGKRARANIINRSPQITELMEALDAWLADSGEDDKRA